jgi:polyphosphate kinase
MSRSAESKRSFFNREWSWLRFNERVLEEAEDENNPLLERLKFTSIFSSNLDEFFMVRVAGLYRQVDAGIPASGTDKRPPREQISGIHETVHALLARQEQVQQKVLRLLSHEGIDVVGMDQLDEAGQEYARRYYKELIYPVLTPMIVGPKHPFPTLQNNTLYLILKLVEKEKGKGRKGSSKDKDKAATRQRIGFVGLPKVLSRFVRVGSGELVRLVPMESILVNVMSELFAGYRVDEVNAIRLTRDADIALDEEATEDMRRAMAKKLLGRRHGAAVRLEHGSRLDPQVVELLRKELEIGEDQCYACRALMQPVDLMQVYGAFDRPDLLDPKMPMISPRDGVNTAIWEWVKQRDRLVYHPYHSFDPVAELVSEAADDPNVLAIKQTLYRTSGNSPIIRALTRAAEAGKSVTVVVELRARFDEARNIEWAQRLEKAGVHVVYGLVGFKTHCKSLLIVRRESDGIRRYMHLGTGNYNDATARIYTDMGLFSADDRMGEDISALFNVITGATQPPKWNKVEMSPTGLKAQLLGMIQRERDKSAPRSRGHIIGKMNSIVDRPVIEALYEASQAGVKVDLIVRGICCLRPGIPGLSENIRVVSIVGRFLEHARIFWFRNGGSEELYLSSADWMPRNLDRRVELMFPVEDPSHRKYIKGVLDLQISDNVKARELLPDGSYARVKRRGPRAKVVDSQVEIHAFTAGKRRKRDVPERFVPLASGKKRV